MHARFGLAVLALALLAGCASASPSQSPASSALAEPVPPAACPNIDLRTPSGSRIDLTGRWRSPDGGTYYLRQSGSCVWFVGLSADTGSPGGVATTDWTNSFFGHVASDFTLRGSWADLPWGDDQGVGVLNWYIEFPEVDGQEAVSLSAFDETGGFGGGLLAQPESDVDRRFRLREPGSCEAAVGDDGQTYELHLPPGWSYAEPLRLLGPSGEEILPGDEFDVVGESARGAGVCGPGAILFADQIEAITTP